MGLHHSTRDTTSAASTVVDWVALLAELTAWSRELRQALSSSAKRADIADAHFWMLWHCHRRQASGLDQSQLARLTDCSTAQVSCIVEQLRQRDLMTCSRDAADRRRQIWRVTPTGQLLIERVLQDLEEQTGPCPALVAQRLLSQLPRIALREIRIHGGAA